VSRLPGRSSSISNRCRCSARTERRLNR
jgi:hypothetical protein